MGECLSCYRWWSIGPGSCNLIYAWCWAPRSFNLISSAAFRGARTLPRLSISCPGPFGIDRVHNCQKQVEETNTPCYSEFQKVSIQMKSNQDLLGFSLASCSNERAYGVDVPVRRSYCVHGISMQFNTPRSAIQLLGQFFYNASEVKSN